MGFVDNLKAALGFKTETSVLVAEVNERASRIARKTAEIIENRSDFSRAAHRMRERGSRPRKKASR